MRTLPRVPSVDPEPMLIRGVREVLRVWHEYPFKPGTHGQLEAKLYVLEHWLEKMEEQDARELDMALSVEGEA